MIYCEPDEFWVILKRPIDNRSTLSRRLRIGIQSSSTFIVRKRTLDAALRYARRHQHAVERIERIQYTIFGQRECTEEWS